MRCIGTAITASRHRGSRVKRRFRLTKATEFKRVRRLGKSYAHPLIVLISHPNKLDITRYGIAAGAHLGNAVMRNRTKRLLHAAINSLNTSIQPGWDIVVIARRPILGASLSDIESSLYAKAKQAGLLI
jgi:ribonuclease P protein component